MLKDMLDDQFAFGSLAILITSTAISYGVALTV
jgi:hypothetical protein